MIHNFVKTPWNFVEGYFSINLTEICKETGEILYTFVGMTSLMSNPKLCNFITLLKQIKISQNFSQVSFSIKLTNICHKNRAAAFDSDVL